MLPILTTAVGLLSRTRLGEKVKDKIGGAISKIGKKRRERKQRAADANKTASTDAFTASLRTSYENETDEKPVDKALSGLGRVLKRVKDDAGPIETEATVKADKSIFLLVGIAAAVALVFAFKK